MTTRARFSVLVAVLSLALSACGGSGGSSPQDKPSATTASVKPATGDTITGTGYAFAAPKGWRTPPQKVPGFDTDTLVVDSADKDGFADNINVLRIDPAPEVDADALQKSSAQELSAANFTDVKVLDQLKIDGATAAHLSSVGNQNGVKYLLDQFIVIHAKVMYAVTFSGSATVTARRQDAVAQSVMATWKWTD